MPFLTTALVAGGIAAAGAIGGSAIKAHAAGEAASAQETAAAKAQALIAKQQADALTAQQTALASTTAAEQPYQSLGSTSANSLQALLQKGFTAPTLTQAEQTPGYQFNLQSGTQAIDENAAATGNLMSGNTGVALTKYGQGLATTTYQQAYQDALNAYNTNYQSLLGGTTVGLNSTGQLASANQNTANNTANIDLTGAQLQASQINNAGAARASGYVQAANAWAPAITSLANFGGQAANTWMPPASPTNPASTPGVF